MGGGYEEGMSIRGQDGEIDTRVAPYTVVHIPINDIGIDSEDRLPISSINHDEPMFYAVRQIPVAARQALMQEETIHPIQPFSDTCPRFLKVRTFIY